MAASEKITRNGVTRPGDGTKTGRIWDIADALSTLHLRPAERKEVLAWADKEGLDPSTAGTQFSHWKNHNGEAPPAPGKVRKDAGELHAETAEEEEDRLFAEETAALEEQYKDDDSCEDRFTDDWGTTIWTYPDAVEKW